MTLRLILPLNSGNRNYYNAPILSLPPELTCIIFTHYVDSPHVGIKSDPGGRHGPLRLASVCKEWRDISLSFGSIWSSLHVYPCGDRDIEDLVKFVKRWLLRAGTHLIDLIIERSFHSSERTRLFSILPSYSKQLRSLNIYLDSRTYLPTEKIQGRVPHLRKITLEISTFHGDTPAVWTAFQDAPSLRQATLTHVSPACVVLPWSQLTHLTFRLHSLSSCLAILRQTTHLEFLSVNLPKNWYDHVPVSHYLVLPHLHTLHLKSDRFGMLLRRFTLPALMTFELSAQSALNDKGVPHLIALGTRSAWGLRIARFNHTSWAITKHCLRANPTLTTVAVAVCETIDDTFSSLVLSLATDAAFLPDLRTLILGSCPSDLDAETLAEAVISRSTIAPVSADGAPGVAPLESLRVFFRNGPTIAGHVLKQRLQSLIDEGLQLFVGTAVVEEW